MLQPNGELRPSFARTRPPLPCQYQMDPTVSFLRFNAHCILPVVAVAVLGLLLLLLLLPMEFLLLQLLLLYLL